MLGWVPRWARSEVVHESVIPCLAPAWPAWPLLLLPCPAGVLSAIPPATSLPRAGSPPPSSPASPATLLPCSQPAPPRPTNVQRPHVVWGVEYEAKDLRFPHEIPRVRMKTRLEHQKTPSRKMKTGCCLHQVLSLVFPNRLV
ncbi:hypothetical protein F4778DRAFT_137174 [Xylariomycetidae sp. FL2044]|nr:hypothetical protein F4778DRAFT_137174 [Xylariomycetidae sp. FL2044]